MHGRVRRQTPRIFFQRIETVGNQSQRQFLALIRNLVVRGGISDDELWRFCRCFVLIHFDFQQEASRDAAYFRLLLQSALESNSAEDARKLELELFEIASSMKRDAGSRSTAMLRATLGGRYQLRPASDAEDQSALAKLRAASASAAGDAAVVEANAKRTIRLDGGLYVERDIEPQILDDLRANEPVLVVGDAGHGKTTLLWHLWTTLRDSPGSEVWLIKPTRLMAGVAGDVRITRGDFGRAIRAALQEQRTVFVLLDTVDILLHDEANADAVRELIAFLHRSSCAVAASTRAAEAPLLRTIDIAWRERRLGIYNERSGELERAVRAHIISFYRDSSGARIAELGTSILDSVGAGLPVRDVCLNPLTLRMLFVLYAPEEVPRDINVAALYEAYWRRRVETDTRPGFAVSHRVDADLSETAEIIALAMLMEGTPEVDLAACERLLARFGLAASDIKRLVSRGVVQLSETKISFFHQTFFEHAAARMLTRRCGGEGLHHLLRRLQERAFDPFIAPVLIQALLLAAKDPLLRDDGDTILDWLLGSGDVSEASAGLYVFAMREDVPADTLDRVRRMIRRRGDEAALSGFFEAAANAPSVRSGEMIELVRTAWEAGVPWRLRQKTFELLERLGARVPAAVIECLDRVDAVGYALRESKKLQPERELRDVLRALAPHEPAWCWAAAVRLYGASASRERPPGLRVAMLALLAERAAAFGEMDLASRFEAAVEAAPQAEDTLPPDDRGDFHAAWARLWSIEWQAAATPISAILGSIPYDKHRAYGRVIALRDLLAASATVADIDHVWRHFSADADAGRRELAMITLWRPFLRNETDGERCAQVRNSIRRAMEEVLPGEDRRAAALRSALVDVVSRSSCNAAVINEIFASSAYADPAPWLDPRRLTRLIGHAYLAGHPGAVRAAALIEADPTAHPKAAECVVRVLADAPLDERRATLVARLAGAAGIDLALHVASAASEESLSRLVVRPEFLAAMEQWRTDPKANIRKDATRLRAKLIDRGALPPPSFTEIRATLQREKDKSHAGHLAQMIGHAAKRGGYDLGEVFDLLEPYARGHEETRTNALEGLISAVLAERRGDALLERALDVITAFPTDQGRLKYARNLLVRLAEVAPRRAAVRFRELIASDAVKSLGVNAKRNLATRIDVAARRVIQVSTPAERVKLVEQLPFLDRFLAPVVIRPLCAYFYADVHRQLDAMLESHVLADGDVELLIRNHAKQHRRVAGSARWPELWQVLSPRSR